MIAYNKTGLDNLFIQKQVAEWYEEGSLTKEECQNIKKAYPVPFYSPNLFIRIGLFILTYIIVSFSSGIIGMMFLSSSEQALGMLMIFLGLVAYAALEYMVRTNNHFRSGVDDALLIISVSLFTWGISFLFINTVAGYCIVALLIAGYLAIRFADRFITAVAFLSLLGIFFFGWMNAGGLLKALLPFILMGISLVTYLITVRINNKPSLKYYKECLQVLSIVSLFTLYGSGNYYIVNELGNDNNVLPVRTVPFGWLFWIFTIAIPLLYLLRGVQKKDSVLIRTGLILIAAFIFTIRYYYSIAPFEIMMILGGMLLIFISYILLRYLKKPQYGFTSEPDKDTGKLRLEALVLAQTFAHHHSNDATRFEGGSFGGGGAGSDF